LYLQKGILSWKKEMFQKKNPSQETRMATFAVAMPCSCFDYQFLAGES